MLNDAAPAGTTAWDPARRHDCSFGPKPQSSRPPRTAAHRRRAARDSNAVPALSFTAGLNRNVVPALLP